MSVLTRMALTILLIVSATSFCACTDGSENKLIPDGDHEQDLQADGDVIPDADVDTDGDVDQDLETDGVLDGDADETDIPVSCEEIGCDEDIDCPQSCICADGLCVDGQELRADLVTDDWRLIYRNDTGLVNIYDSQGRWLLRNGHAAIWLDESGKNGQLLDVSDAETRSMAISTADTRLGNQTTVLTVTVQGDDTAPGLIWTLSAYPDGSFLTAQIELVNTTSSALQFAKASVLMTDGTQGGGLFLGTDPATHRILENGSYTYFDFFADIRTGDAPRDGLLAGAVPGNFKGNSASSWNHAVADLNSDAVWIAGALSFESSSPIINLSYVSQDSVQSPDGRNGFSYFSAEAAYEPHPKPVPAGESFESELYYFRPAETSLFDGVENWALAVKHWLNITLWHERPGNRIPNGWNSWTTSGGTGGYGTGITEEIILANLDVMATELRDWGIDWFQIDDGYQKTYGDWWWVEDKFPHGPAWLAQQIRDKGMRPGLWMAPFTLYDDSQTLQEHPDWLAGHSTAGALFSGGYKIFDLTHPEVKAHLQELFRTFKQDWGFDWLKMDFAYYALLGDDFYDPTQTREEAYRGAVRLIREQIGEDTFFLSVSALGAHFGLADGDRLTLDNMPVWDKEPDQNAKSLEQGFKPTVRTAARRYYLHDRIWVNHSDLIVFRSNTNNESWPRVTLTETLAFCTYVGLTGGIVKLGDKLVDLTGEQINIVRALLPIYPHGARPLDMLRREFPEFWHKRVVETLDGFAEPYDLVGLFNWGHNVDQTTNPYTDIPDDGQERTVEVQLADIGLDATKSYLAYEFWTETFLGEVSGSFNYEVPSHAGRVLAIREVMNRPQFIGWNRQITMGGVLLSAMQWDEEQATLAFSTQLAEPTEKAPFTYRMVFHVPQGYAFNSVDIVGQTVDSLETQQQERILSIAFVPTETGEVSITLHFDKE